MNIFTKSIIIGLVFVFAIVVQARTTEIRTSVSSTDRSVVHYLMVEDAVDNATSSAVSIAGAKKAEVYISYDNPVGAGVGTTTFSVEVSPNGSDWYDYNKLISNVTNTNSQTLTRVGTVVATATTTAMYALDLTTDTFRDVRCIADMQATTSAKIANCEVTVEF